MSGTINDIVLPSLLEVELSTWYEDVTKSVG